MTTASRLARAASFTGLRRWRQRRRIEGQPSDLAHAAHSVSRPVSRLRRIRGLPQRARVMADMRSASAMVSQNAVRHSAGRWVRSSSAARAREAVIENGHDRIAARVVADPTPQPSGILQDPFQRFGIPTGVGRDVHGVEQRVLVHVMRRPAIERAAVCVFSRRGVVARGTDISLRSDVSGYPGAFCGSAGSGMWLSLLI